MFTSAIRNGKNGGKGRLGMGFTLKNQPHIHVGIYCVYLKGTRIFLMMSIWVNISSPKMVIFLWWCSSHGIKSEQIIFKTKLKTEIQIIRFLPSKWWQFSWWFSFTSPACRINGKALSANYGANWSAKVVVPKFSDCTWYTWMSLDGS